MTATYVEFLGRKLAREQGEGIPTEPQELISYPLHPFQAYMTAWALTRGRAAIWADTGLGKTRMQLVWAQVVNSVSMGRKVLILAPLAVTRQTVIEARAMGIACTYVLDHAAAQAAPSGIVITNYERLHLFDTTALAGVVLDESSILKDVTSKTRDALIAAFAATPYRLACTATPAPNDITEIANHAEFLGVAKRRHMLATYFANDMKGNWRVKGHAVAAMWRWIAGWAMAARRPSDLGFDDTGYDLPPLNIRTHLLPVDVVPDNQLIATDLGGVSGRAAVRRATLQARCETAAELVDPAGHAWLLWCGMNDEADRLVELVPGAVNVHGGLSPERKADLLVGFAAGDFPVLVTKPSIAGFGMNWQHCARMAFVGLGDSYEAYYQSIRRCWRYGQLEPVDVHIVLSQLEGQIAANVARKERAAQTTQLGLIEAQRELREAS